MTLLNSINMSFESRTGLCLIFLNVSSSQKVVFYKGFEFLCCSLVLNRNKDGVIRRLLKLINEIIVSITKFSIVIGSSRAYLSSNRRAITWVSDYRCPI